MCLTPRVQQLTDILFPGQIAGISGGWIGIVWIWNIVIQPLFPIISRTDAFSLFSPQVWFMPLDLIKFGMKALIKSVRSNQAAKRAKKLDYSTGVPITRTQSRAASINQSLYSNRTNFLTRASRRMGLGKKVSVTNNELQRFSSYQAAQSGAVIARSASRPQ